MRRRDFLTRAAGLGAALGTSLGCAPAVPAAPGYAPAEQRRDVADFLAAFPMAVAVVRGDGAPLDDDAYDAAVLAFMAAHQAAGFRYREASLVPGLGMIVLADPRSRQVALLTDNAMWSPVEEIAIAWALTRLEPTPTTATLATLVWCDDSGVTNDARVRRAEAFANAVLSACR